MTRSAILPALAQRVRGGGRTRYLTLTATTTGAATVTITRLKMSVPTVISWGDGATTAHPAGIETAITHNYAGAGTWSIRVPRAEAITMLRLEDARLGGLDTAQLRGSRLTYFYVTAITGSTINSADMVTWRPNYWFMYSLPAGGTYTIDTAHMVAWRPIYLWMYSLPAGSYTFAAACMRYWTTATLIYLNDLGLLQPAVNAILYDIWAGFATRTGTGGTINVGGTNAAPSGTFQAATFCPVTVATPGKEIAHELLNDTCNVSSKHWGTVTITA